MTIEKEKARQISDEIRLATQEIFKKHGLAAPKISTKYGQWYEVKMEASELRLDESGVNLASKEAEYYTQFGYPGLKAPLGTKFEMNAGTYVFEGIAASRRKYPILARRLDNDTRYFFPVNAIAVINVAAGVAAGV